MICCFAKAPGHKLVIWNERAEGADGVTVNFGGNHASVKVYDPITGISAIQTSSNTNAVPLVLSDHPVVIEL